jgi:hypothetical protein
LDDGPPDLLPWTVTGLSINTQFAWSLLTYLHQHDLPAAVRLGSDGRFTFTAAIQNDQLIATPPDYLPLL